MGCHFFSDLENSTFGKGGRLLSTMFLTEDFPSAVCTHLTTIFHTFSGKCVYIYTLRCYEGILCFQC
jgi:hypothetical protein